MLHGDISCTIIQCNFELKVHFNNNNNLKNTNKNNSISVAALHNSEGTVHTGSTETGSKNINCNRRMVLVS